MMALDVDRKTPDSGDLAAKYHVNLDLPADQLVRKAVEAINTAESLNIAAGLALLKAKELCAHGEFEKYLKEVDLPPQRAREHMAITRMLVNANADERRRLLQQPKTALMGIARMDPEVRQQMLDAGELDERLTLEEYKQLVAEQKISFKEQEARLSGLHRRLEQLEGRKREPGEMPAAVEGLRAELNALIKKAQLCIDGFRPIGVDLTGLYGSGADEWVRPSGQLLVSGLIGLRLQMDDVINYLVEGFALNAQDLKEPDVLAGLSKFEVVEIAGVYQGLIRAHEHEAALRQYERDQERPKGKGRPKAAPKAPE